MHDRKWKCVLLDLVDDDSHLYRHACRHMVFTMDDSNGTEFATFYKDTGPRLGHEQCGYITPLGVFPSEVGSRT